MTGPVRRALAALGTVGLLTVPGIAGAQRVVARSARERPAWLYSAPATASGLAYFVGAKSGSATLDSAKEGATQDAAAQAAAFVRANVSGKLLIKRGPLENRIAEEIRSSAQGRLEGARIAGLYWEKNREGYWPFKGDHYDVWVLVEYPQAQAARERERLTSLENEFSARMEGLCATLADFILGAPAARVQVAGFKESLSQARRPFSRIVEEQLKACLARRKISIEASPGSDLLITGEYWRAPDHVEVAAKILEEGRGRLVKAASARLPTEAVEPLWLTGDEGAEEEFFSAPDLTRPPAGQRPGAISVRSQPPGARIFVDGADRGATPSDVLGVLPGVRSVAVSLEGYVPASSEVEVEPEQKAAVRLVLKRKTGELSVRALPKGVRVLLDGKHRGSSPLTLPDLPIGNYQVRLELKNYKPMTQAVEIEFGKTATLDPQLTEEDGFIAALIEPPGARILLDGREIGESRAGKPLRLGPVSAGAHTVSAEKTGCLSGEWQVRVRAFQTHSVTGALAAAPSRPVREEVMEADLPRRKEGVDWSGKRRAIASWFDRPDGMVYINGLGGAVGAGYYNLRIIEMSVYGYSSTIGMGTSLVEATGTNMKIEKSGFDRWGNHTGPPSKVNVTMTSVFPLKFYLAPFVHAYKMGNQNLVSSAQFYFTICPWAVPNTGDGGAASDPNKAPFGTVMDYGLMLHPGAIVGLRIGQTQSYIRSFKIGDDLYGGLNDRKFYIAADISLGVFVPGK